MTNKNSEHISGRETVSKTTERECSGIMINQIKEALEKAENGFMEEFEGCFDGESVHHVNSFFDQLLERVVRIVPSHSDNGTSIDRSEFNYEVSNCLTGQ